MNLSGTYTALITPFKKNGEFDEESFRLLATTQARSHNHLVPCGTTGESPTLDLDEHIRAIEIAVEVAKGFHGIQVIAGIGSNNTKEAQKLAEKAGELGADAGLSVIPYYNKPGQEGNYRHQVAVADVGLPIVVYNIPGRCGGAGLLPEKIIRLAEHKNIVGLKAAAGVNEDLTTVLMRRPKDFAVLCGDDTLSFYMLSAGAEGIVSVMSNALPSAVHEYVDTMVTSRGSMNANQRYAHGRQLYFSLFPLFRASMTFGTNPEAIKEVTYIRRKQLLIPDYEPTLRSPMTRLTEKDRRTLQTIISNYDR
jgi:4-hydroxy-tetrahydrodipicolinate synthase